MATEDLSAIREIPRWWRFVPFLGDELATTIYPAIYVPREMYEDVFSNTPSDQNIAVLIHEAVHLVRQEEYGSGTGRWKWKYLSSQSFRLGEELTAIRAEMEYRNRKGLSYDFERKARHFSSGAYLWVLPYERSLDILRELWNDTTI